LPMRHQDKLLLNFVAAPCPSVQRMQAVVVDGDAMNIACAARDCSFLLSAVGITGRFRVRFQFAVAVIPPAGAAGRRVIGPSVSFKERPWRAPKTFSELVTTFTAGRDRADARSGEDARVRYPHAYAADAHGSLFCKWQVWGC